MRALTAVIGVFAFATQAFAQTPAPMPSQSDIANQLQRISGNKNSSKVMAQVMVVGTLLGCTQKTAGKQATQAFYQDVQAIGKQAETYCKENKAKEARELLLATFTAKKDDPVVKAGLACYDQQSAMVAALGGPEIAADANHYSRWLKDPEIAKTEMQESDICRNSKAAPVPAVSSSQQAPAQVQ